MARTQPCQARPPKGGLWARSWTKSMTSCGQRLDPSRSPPCSRLPIAKKTKSTGERLPIAEVARSPAANRARSVRVKEATALSPLDVGELMKGAWILDDRPAAVDRHTPCSQTSKIP